MTLTGPVTPPAILLYITCTICQSRKHYNLFGIAIWLQLSQVHYVYSECIKHLSITNLCMHEDINFFLPNLHVLTTAWQLHHNQSSSDLETDHWKQFWLSFSHQMHQIFICTCKNPAVSVMTLVSYRAIVCYLAGLAKSKKVRKFMNMLFNF